MAARASLSSSRFSSLESRGSILRFSAALQKAQGASLFHTAIHLAPKLLEVLKCGSQRAQDYHPDQNSPHEAQGLLLRAPDYDANREHLQDHLRFAQRRCWNRESLRG